MAVVVSKYGGSSLASADQVRAVADRIARAHRAGDGVVAVVSARGDATDELLALAATVSGVLPAREVDQLLATGECALAALLAIALHGRGVPAVSLTGPQAGIVATGRHGDGRVAAVHTDRIARVLAGGSVAVVAGFQGLDVRGDVVTLGRGGSDTAAVAVAAALGARGCDIRTDVAGVYTADPRLVPDARPHRRLDPAVMVELAFAGARVLHPRAAIVARAHGIDLHIGDARSTAPGTVIPAGPLEERHALAAVAHDPDVAHVLVRARRAAPEAIFRVLAEQSIPIDLAASSSPLERGLRMGFTVRRADLGAVAEPLRRAVPGARVTVDDRLGTVSLVGTGLLHRPDVAARATSALRAAGIPATWTHASQLRLTIVTDRARAADAVAVLHAAFHLDREEELVS